MDVETLMVNIETNISVQRNTSLVIKTVDFS